MINIKNLTILGASPSSEIKLKNLIHKTLKQEINWVKAFDKRMDGIIINSNFLSSEQVQKIITSKPNFKAVCYCCNNNKEKSVALSKKYGLSILNIDNPKSQDLASWINKLTKIKINPSDIQNIFYGENTQKKHSDYQNSKIENLNKLSVNYMTLLAHVDKKSGSYIVHYNQDNRTALLSLNQGKVYLNFNKNRIPSIGQSRWEEYNSTDIPKDNIFTVMLDAWIFETIWASNICYANKIDENKKFNLVRWPQPLNTDIRSKALLITACIQRCRYANIQQLQQQTNFEKAVVSRFLYAALRAGYINTSDNHTKNSKTILNTQKKQKNLASIGLLNKLRAKLGIG